VLAKALKVRCRAEVAAGRIDAALRTEQTMFAMSQHLGEHLTLIGELVGVAIAQGALDPLEEMLERPDCPNLYWALTYLPSPLVPIDKCAQGERIWVKPAFNGRDESAAMSAEQLERLADVGDFVGSKGHLTTRQNMQFHFVPLTKFPDAMLT